MSDHVYGARPPEVASRNDVTGAEEVVVIFLGAGPNACAQATAMVLAHEFFPRSVQDDVALLVTELVTNAGRHTNGGVDPGVRVELRRWADFVRVEVAGEGAAFTVDGPGLVLVDQIADRRGVAPPTSETSAWFEVRTSDEPRNEEHRADRPGRNRGAPRLLKNATALLMGR